MEANRQTQDQAIWMKNLITDFINQSPENTMKNADNEKAWADPLVGFSRGDDPLYQDFKEHVGAFHWTPLEIFSKTFPELTVTADELSVISWILPQTERTKADNRQETAYPSERWARTRIFGEEVNVKLRKQVIAVLQEKGIKAVAPMISPLWEWKDSDRYGFASTWSERHAAYASGLGTFGLCDGLITPRGKAMRCGSIVAQIRIPPTDRPYKNHQAYCLFFSQGICGKCIKRCPTGALSREGHDKVKCKSYLHPVTADYVKAQFGFDGYGCGLCQTGVPCESKIPMEE
ncbi:MAG: epoxyqueuosine reductase [Thermodesulfobacteriota bacterium]|nr:epoxyqueuosine reductase [Thermodesulfobacteriota bacterium]